MSRIWTTIVRSTAPRLATRSQPVWQLQQPHTRRAHTKAPKLAAADLKGYLELVGAKRTGKVKELKARLAAIVCDSSLDMPDEARFEASGLDPKADSSSTLDDQLHRARRRLTEQLVADGLCRPFDLDTFCEKAFSDKPAAATKDSVKAQGGLDEGNRKSTWAQTVDDEGFNFDEGSNDTPTRAHVEQKEPKRSIRDPAVSAKKSGRVDPHTGRYNPDASSSGSEFSFLSGSDGDRDINDANRDRNMHNNLPFEHGKSFSFPKESNQDTNFGRSAPAARVQAGELAAAPPRENASPLATLRGAKRREYLEKLLRSQVLSLYRRCLRSTQLCPDANWEKTMVYYVKSRFRDDVPSGNLAVSIAIGENELENMNFYHAAKQLKDVENSDKEWH